MESMHINDGRKRTDLGRNGLNEVKGDGINAQVEELSQKKKNERTHLHSDMKGKGKRS